MSMFARGIIEFYVTFTQYPFIFDDFLKSVDLTENEYNAIKSLNMMIDILMRNGMKFRINGIK